MNGSIVLVTGVSSGIGAACVEQFLQAGATVIGWARRTPQHVEHHANFVYQQVDVRNREQVKQALEQLPSTLHSIDILVNNAGLSRGLSPLHEGDVADWEEMIDTNLKGLLWVTKEILPSMVERGSGMIINIASVAGRQAYRGGNVYGATKAAVRMLGQNMQIDLNGTGVRVCNIDPGMVETEFSIVRFHGDEERASTVYKGLTPLTANDVAEVVMFVATRPPHVSVHDILLMPTDQASATIAYRRD